MSRRWELAEGEYIISAWAEDVSGPGWSNQPIWVLIGSRGGSRYRQECIQPKDQTPELRMLFAFSALAHSQMVAQVRRLYKEG